MLYVMPYVEMMRIRFLTMLAYRLNYLSGILTYIIYTGGYYFLWGAVYGDRQSLGGMTSSQMTTYLAIAWMTRAFYFNNLDREVAEEVRSGAVAIQMIRPVNYVLSKVASAFGEGLFRLLFWMAPGMLLATWLFPLHLPQALSTWLTWAFSGACAFLINALINVIFGLITFYLHSAQGLQWGKQIATDILSGLWLPLHLYPGWMQIAVRWMPFQAISYLPNLIFTGGLQGSAVWRAIGVQATWVLVLGGLTWALWERARRNLIVQGG